MKTLNKSILIVVCITLLGSAQLFGQEWSEQQKEVWKNVETYANLWAKRDLEGFLAYFHDDFSGWGNADALPRNKARIRKFNSHNFETTKVLVTDIQPVGVNIFDNVAIVQYYFTDVLKDKEGKEQTVRGRWTDILMKQGDKWVIIGDHGGSTE
jgi:ketosteroid isomerase-like protein